MAFGEGAVGAQLEPALRRLGVVITHERREEFSPSHLTNLAVAIGRLGIACPQRAAQQSAEVLGLLAEDWLGALQWVLGDDERDQAFKGLVMLAMQPAAWQALVAGPIYPSFLRAVASWHYSDNPMSPELKQALQQLISAASQQMGPGHDPGAYLNERDIPEADYRAFLQQHFVFA